MSAAALFLHPAQQNPHHKNRSSKAVINPLLTADTATLLPFWVVGNDDGFWPSLSTPLTTLQMGPAERYDVVIDFSGEGFTAQ
jgi:FtsP/CotA-like multicopper oxidase with cupredoxin domain